MKKLNSKLLGVMIGIGFAGVAQAQTVIYSENFESTALGSMPANMKTLNKDQQALKNFGTLLPNNAAWAVQNGTSTGGNYTNSALTSSYFTNTSAQANRWMITPQITLTNPAAGLKLILKWDAITFKSAPNYEVYDVLISTTDTALASFTNTVANITNEATGGSLNTQSFDITAYKGQKIYVAFHYKSTGQYFLMLDNISVAEVAGNDVALNNIYAPAYVLPATNANITGTFTNTGSSILTSVNVNWNVNGGAVNTQIISGLNVAPYATATFIHNKALNLPNLGSNNLKVWVSSPNGQADATNGDDTSKMTLKVVSVFPPHCVTIEEATGTWCGWCVRGAVYMDSISKVHPNTTVLIAVHNADPMTVTAYDSNMGVPGYPNALYNRKTLDDPSTAFTHYDALINDFGYADLSLSGAFIDLKTMKVTGYAFTHFATALSGDYRLAMVLTEDSVTGTASGYDQHNYYSSASQNIPLVGAGHNWQNEPAIVPASRMKYDFVAREITGGFNGQAGSLPTNIPDGFVQWYTFTSSTLTTVVRPGKLRAHFLLMDATNKVILNGKSVNVKQSTTGIKDVKEAINDLSVYPNPVQDQLKVSFGLNNESFTSVKVTNVLGQTVVAEVNQKLGAGNQELMINTSTLSKGVYFVQVGTSKGVVSQRFVKE